jgi:molybdate transport repressor ModE-like protein
MSVAATTLPAQAGLRWSWVLDSTLSEADTTRLFALLAALVVPGALGNAARAAGLSYRTAWGLLRRCEAVLGASLVVMARGRGTQLTELGAAIMALDRSARQALAEAHTPWEARLRTLLAPVAESPPARLRIAASHDLALADWFEHGRDIRFDLSWRGSEEALAGLGREEFDLAGFHVPEAWSATQLAGWLGRWLKPKQHCCIPVMRRCQGLIVARGNPLQLATLADLAARGARMVNRQRGSGTRSLVDQLLLANGLQAEGIDGYTHEEFTHEAVAATVASGQADVGFGIEAVAARYDLDFVPLIEERYGFALSRNIAASEATQAFLAHLFGRTFQQRLQALPGYQGLAEASAIPGGWGEFLKMPVFIDFPASQ